MSETRWQRLQEEVLHCLGLGNVARAARLRELAGQDPDFSREVEQLLAEERRAERIRPGAALSDLAATEATADPVGRRVGAWRLLRRLGRGGMGEVWEAERVEGGFAQRAAIKLVAAPLSSQGMGERFRRERELLAGLEHPHIARLIDGGDTEQGEPYLVMELVEGEAIDRWCERAGLGVRARVELVAEVCDAVHFAHQRLVVHRDIKPSNILVTASGGSKLLDFGVAKLLEADAVHELTSAGFLTPRYASPEQVRGDPITTATDVYSLAVVLYELLTGANPYGISSTSALEIAQAVARTEPRRASQAVDERASVTRRAGGRRRLARLLAGDLDTILAKALAKQPARRYATASELAADLRRHLDGMPVAARPDSLAYRARKLVGRHKLASAALLSLLVSLLAGLVVSWRITARAVRAEERAQRRFDQVRELARSLVFGVHDRVSTLGGSTEVRQYLVDTTRSYLDELAADGELTPELASELAETYLRLAEVQGGHTRGGTGDVEGALSSARRALELWESLPGGRARVEARLAATHGLLGDLERFAGRLEAARAHYEELERLGTERLERDAGDVVARHDVARALAQRGRLAHLGGDRRLSLELEREARALLQPLAGNPEVARSVVVGTIRIAEELNALGEPARAIEELRSAIGAAAAARSSAPHDAQLALDHANALRELARSRAALHEWPAAHACLESAVGILRPIHAADLHNFVLGESLSIALETLGGWRRSHGELDAALALYQEALSILEALHASAPSDRYARDGVASLTALVGLVEQDLGRTWEAGERFERVLLLLGPEPAGEDERTAELRFTVRLALLDLELAEGDSGAAALETLWAAAEALTRRFPDVAWPARKRGLIASRLGTWLEQRAVLGSRPIDERRSDLERASELFALGAEDGRRLRAKSWLLESELDLVERFEADVKRCGEALAALDLAVGP